MNTIEQFSLKILDIIESSEEDLKSYEIGWQLIYMGSDLLLEVGAGNENLVMRTILDAVNGALQKHKKK